MDMVIYARQTCIVSLLYGLKMQDHGFEPKTGEINIICDN